MPTALFATHGAYHWQECQWAGVQLPREGKIGRLPGAPIWEGPKTGWWCDPACRVALPLRGAVSPNLSWWRIAGPHFSEWHCNLAPGQTSVALRPWAPSCNTLEWETGPTRCCRVSAIVHTRWQISGGSPVYVQYNFSPFPSCCPKQAILKIQY